MAITILMLLINMVTLESASEAIHTIPLTFGGYSLVKYVTVMALNLKPALESILQCQVSFIILE